VEDLSTLKRTSRSLEEAIIGTNKACKKSAGQNEAIGRKNGVFMLVGRATSAWEKVFDMAEKMGGGGKGYALIGAKCTKRESLRCLPRRGKEH